MGKTEPSQMRGIVWTRYGAPESLQLEELPKPVPKDNEVLVKVRAATGTAGDCELRRLDFSPGVRLLLRMVMGPFRPRRRILGQDLAGEVVEVGKAVNRVRVGDEVFGSTGFRFGAYADFICLTGDPGGGTLTIKPRQVSYEEAACVPTGGFEALHLLQHAGDLSGKRVLIVGAGGSIGMVAVQLAKLYGAQVTGVDRCEKLSLIQSLGAEEFVDFTRRSALAQGVRFEVILDTVGKGSHAGQLEALLEGGYLLLANSDLRTTLRGAWGSLAKRIHVFSHPSGQSAAALDALKELLGAGKLRSVIDRRFPLEQTALAHRYFETGVPRGKVVITF